MVVDAGAPLAGDVGFFVAGVVRSLAPLFIAKMTTSRSERSGSNTVNFTPAFGWNAVCLTGFRRSKIGSGGVDTQILPTIEMELV